MKRLIKTQTNILPYKIYQITDYYIAEKNDVEVFRTKFQHPSIVEELKSSSLIESDYFDDTE